VIWPLSVVFLDRSLLLAFCRLRMDFRRFHLHRITQVQETGESFRPRRVPLLREFIRLLRGERDR
jgi:predicted DNA-binding transcriptional regulator YafY